MTLPQWLSPLVGLFAGGATGYLISRISFLQGWRYGHRRGWFDHAEAQYKLIMGEGRSNQAPKPH